MLGFTNVADAFSTTQGVQDQVTMADRYEGPQRLASPGP